eukprot:g11117.t2
MHGDGDWSGSISPATPTKSAIAATQGEIEAVGKDIKAVEAKIETVEAALSGGPAYLGISDRGVLLKQLEQLLEKEKQLREEKKQLREKENQLREEKLVLLKEPAASAAALSVPKPLADFGAVLTRAVVADNTLELVDGTFFLGEPELRSKLFIRPCYEYLSEVILEGWRCG